MAGMISMPKRADSMANVPVGMFADVPSAGADG